MCRRPYWLMYVFIHLCNHHHHHRQPLYSSCGRKGFQSPYRAEEYSGVQVPGNLRVVWDNAPDAVDEQEAKEAVWLAHRTKDLAATEHQACMSPMLRRMYVYARTTL